MSKIFLQDSFKEFCEINKLEVNVQQIKIINSLEKFLNNKATILTRILKQKEKLCLLKKIEHKTLKVQAILRSVQRQSYPT